MPGSLPDPPSRRQHDAAAMHRMEPEGETMRARVLYLSSSVALLVAGHALAEAPASQPPGGTLSTTPGVGGVGVRSGDVPGGTLSTTPGVGGVGAPASASTFSLFPGLVIPVPGSVAAASMTGSTGTSSPTPATAPAPATPPAAPGTQR
jgi:hypothetical protein